MCSAISLYAKGARADNFPTPVACVTSESPLWDWYEVARWMRGREGKVGLDEVLRARIVRDVNQFIVRQEPPHKRTMRRIWQLATWRPAAE